MKASAGSIKKKHLPVIHRATTRGAHRKRGTQKRHGMAEPIRTAVRLRRSKGAANLSTDEVNQIGLPHLKLRGCTGPGIANGHQPILGRHGMPEGRGQLIGAHHDVPQGTRLPVEDRDRAHCSPQRPRSSGSPDNHVVLGEAHGQTEQIIPSGEGGTNSRSTAPDSRSNRNAFPVGPRLPDAWGAPTSTCCP